LTGKNGNKIRLKLSDEWYRFNGTNFVEVKNRRNYVIGDILKKGNRFYMTRKNGLKEIKDNLAYKKMFRMAQKVNPDNFQRGYFRGRRYRRNSSKNKVAISLNQTTGVHVHERRLGAWVKTDVTLTFHLSDERVKELIRIINDRINPNFHPPSFTPEAMGKANKEMKRIVNKIDRIEIENDSLIVKSTNGKVYRINLKTGGVTSDKKPFICTYHDGAILPLPDEIIAKALTIAYKPKQINTL
jgi:hypothetical protein